MRKRVRYVAGEDGRWFLPRRRYWFHRCCDCGLVHRVEFKVANVVVEGQTQTTAQILTRWWRDNRRTAASRRKK